jgi:LysM repeat protein
MSRLKFNRVVLPARGFVLFLITNKYLFHFALIIAAGGTIYTNLQTQQALAHDVGQQSLLYTIMTNGDTEIIQEEIRFDETVPEAQRLALGTIEAIPHIDFDYSTDDEGPSLSVPQMPGTLVLRPMDLEKEAKENVVKRVRSGVETYTVQAGDSLGTIARDFDIDVGTILFANNLSERQYIRPGDQLKILPVSGVYGGCEIGGYFGRNCK